MSQLQQFMTDGPLPPSANRRSPWRMITALAAVLVLLAAVGSVFLVKRTEQAAGDFTGPGSGTVEIVVARGDTLTQIGRTLKQAGVVATVDAFVSAATVSDQAAMIGPGRYTLRKAMSAQQALALMLDPASRAGSRLVLPEGLRMSQTVTLAAEATNLPVSAFKKALESPAGLGLPAWAKDRPEGFLFPASYDLAGDETPADVLTRLFARFDQSSTDLNLVQRAKERGLEPYDVLTIASIVQAEGHPDDFSKVARVIYNRLDAGMPLQMDATVAYGLGVTDLTLSQEQLASDTPYNSYVNEGLPPTPINSPGEAAIQAALDPAKGKWLYYVTVNPDTGETKFTRNYDKFLEFKQEFQDYLKSKG